VDILYVLLFGVAAHYLLVRLLFLVSPLGKSCPCPALLGLSLIGQSLNLSMLTLHCVNGLKQDTLVLELVTLGMEVEGVVDVLINFLGVTHLVEETTEHTDATHPEHLEGETRIGGTTTLTSTGVTSLALGLIALPHSVSRVNNGRLLHNKPILLQASNVAAGVGQRNFIDFVGVQPDLALSAFEHGCGEALL